MYRLNRILVLVWLCIASVQLNIVQAQVTTIGREFYVGFMENNRIVPDRLDKASIIISASEDASGTIQYISNTVSFEVKAGEQFVYEFPEDGIDIIHRSSGQIENKGVFVRSNGNIAVHAFNFRERSADGTVILPLSSIGKDYWVTAHHEEFAPGVNSGSNVNYESTLLVVAAEDDTAIEIVTSAPTVNTIPAGAPINVTLKRGESYQIKATGDLTGSRIRVVESIGDDCKNIAVFGGNKMTSVGLDCEGTTGDHLYQQIYPTFSWGTEYVHIPLAGRTSGEMVKVLAAENGTAVFLNGTMQTTLNAGKFTSFVFDQDELANISASKPIAVTVFSKSQWCNVQDGPLASNGDPSMITLSPNTQLIKETSFSAVKVVGIVNHYLNLLVKTEAATKTVLDGNLVGNSFQPVPGNPSFSYARIEVSEGSHTLKNPDGVIGYVYGSGFIESYGYSAGASLNNLNFETEVSYDFEVEGDKVACLGKAGTWTVLPVNPKFELFEWTFGDGTPMQEGASVDHLFSLPGKYEIKIVAMTGDRSCDQIEEAFFEVEVVESRGEISGPEHICPLIDEGLYVFEAHENTASVLWEVQGGEVITADDYSVRVRWGSHDPAASVTAIPFTGAGCLGAPVLFPVLINEAIVPGKAKGLTQICYLEGATHFYEVKDVIDGRSYQWFIEGGEIITGENDFKVAVEWNGALTEGKIWYEESSMINSSCNGISQELEVMVNLPLSAEVASFTASVCAGSQDGEIELLVSGGTGDYLFQWSHDETLATSFAHMLPAGIYEVLVKDAGGCEVLLGQIEIVETQPMSLVGELFVTDAKCFTSADGVVVFQLAGGTPPYRIEGVDVVVSNSEVQLYNLKRGDYHIIVYDDNNCELPLDFSIGSPEPLQAAIQIEKFACTGLANGALLAMPQGGVGPYSILWEWDNSSNPRLEEIPSGEYGYQLTDSNGCTASFSTTLSDGTPQLRMPTGFNPIDGLYQGVGNCEVPFKLFVYSKWGELLFSGESGWDGKISGEDAPMGSYSYMIAYSYYKDGELKTIQERGVFMLVR